VSRPPAWTSGLRFGFSLRIGVAIATSDCPRWRPPKLAHQSGPTMSSRCARPFPKESSPAPCAGCRATRKVSIFLPSFWIASAHLSWSACVFARRKLITGPGGKLDRIEHPGARSSQMVSRRDVLGPPPTYIAARFALMSSRLLACCCSSRRKFLRRLRHVVPESPISAFPEVHPEKTPVAYVRPSMILNYQAENGSVSTPSNHCLVFRIVDGRPSTGECRAARHIIHHASASSWPALVS